MKKTVVKLSREAHDSLKKQHEKAKEGTTIDHDVLLPNLGAIED